MTHLTVKIGFVSNIVKRNPDNRILYVLTMLTCAGAILFGGLLVPISAVFAAFSLIVYLSKEP